MLGKVAIALSIPVLMLSLYLYCPVPDNIQEPWKTRAVLAALKFNELVVQSAAFLGFDALKVNRVTLPVVFRAAGRNMYNSSSVQVTIHKFGSVKIRLYIPTNPAVRPMPGLVYFHGGGFIIFDANTYDKVIRDLCEQTDHVIVVPEYRLSPEHLFPAAVRDCIEVTEYFVKNAEKYGVNSERIGVAGDSAGGNLAAAVSHALAYQSKSGTKIEFQALIYPMLQAFDFQLPSFVLNNGILAPTLRTDQVVAAYLQYWKGTSATKYISQLQANKHTTLAMKRSEYANYLDTSNLPKEVLDTVPEDFSESVHEGDEALSKNFKQTLLNPLFSPLLADDVSKLPPTLVLVGGHDVLRDDGLLYAARLRKAGVSVRIMRYDDGFHAMFSFTRLRIGRDALLEVVHFMKSTH